MNKVAVSLALMLLVATLAPAKAQPNLDDVRASFYCITHDPTGFLPGLHERSVSLRFIRHDRSRSGERHLLIFVRRAGGGNAAFDLVTDGRRYEIVNNATLKVRRGAGYGGVDFVNEAQGGLWTHKFIARNFLRALRAKPVVIDTFIPAAQRPYCRSLTTPQGYR